MKLTNSTRIIGFIVIALGLVGLVSGNTQLAGAMNTDFSLDLIRMALGAYLVFAGFKSVETSRTALTVFGVAYLGMFVTGILSSTLFGLAPHELGWMDQTLHLGGGLIAFFLSMARSNRPALA